MNEIKETIARTLRAQSYVISLFARKLHAAENPHEWEHRYNKHIAKLRGMLDMAANFNYVAKFDYKDNQGYYAEIVGFLLIYEDDDGTPLTSTYYELEEE